MLRYRAFSALAIAALLVAPGARARTAHQVVGGEGDAERTFECPPGKMLAGFSGNSGTWIDQIGAICAEANANRTFRQPIVTGPTFGGRGGTGQVVYCPVGAVLAGIESAYTRNRQVASLTLTCRIATNGQSAGQLYFGNKDYVASRRPFGGGSFGISNSNQQCPGGELPTGFTVRFGAHVNAIGLICDRIAYPVAAAPAPAKPPPIVTAPSPSAPEAMPLHHFASRWDTSTDQNANFRLVLRVTDPGLSPGSRMTFAGTFTHSDESRYNGTLEGFIRPGTRTLEYAFSQPGIDSEGKGTFTLSSDGQSISGTGMAGTTPFVWNGRRAP